MNLLTITDNIATVAATISGVRGASGQELDTIPVTPFVMVGLPRAFEVVPGDRQITNMAIPIWLYIERVSDQKRDLRVAYGFIPTFVTTFALNGSLSGAVTHIYITAWDPTLALEVGGSTYWAIEFTATVTVHEQVTQGYN